MKQGNELVGDPKCWDCGIMVHPTRVYGPLRCSECFEKRFFRPLETLELGKVKMKTAVCKDCEVTFELPAQRGRPAMRCVPCRTKAPTVMSFAKVNTSAGTKETVELKLETIDGVTWQESSEPCVTCNKVFMRPRKRGRPPTKCPDCSAWDDAEKAVAVTTSQETLDELFSGDKTLLNGTPEAIPKGAEAQCPKPRGCGRIFTSDSACEDHKVYGPKGNLAQCKDPATLGMEPRTRRELPVWTRPTPKELV